MTEHDDLNDTDDYGSERETITKGALSRFARVDERTRAIQEDLRHFREDVKNSMVSLIERIKETEIRHNERINMLQRSHAELNEHLEKNFVKKESFSPVQHLVYGFVGLIVTSVLAAIFSLVIVVKQ